MKEPSPWVRLLLKLLNDPDWARGILDVEQRIDDAAWRHLESLVPDLDANDEASSR